MINLHVFPASPRSFKVMAVAEHLGLDYKICLVDLTKGDQERPEFVALNPNGRVPVMDDDGFVLWEANAIMQYLATKKPASGLLPTDERRRADVTRWQCWDLAHWDPACATLIFERLVKKLLALGPEDPSEIAKGEEKFHRCAEVLNGHLKGRKYVAVDALTVADFSIGASLNVAEPAGIPLDKYPEIRRWHANLSELPAWRKSQAVPG